MKKLLVAALAAFVLAGCSYTAAPVTVASYNVYSSYSGKVPGKFLLYVNAGRLDTTVRPSDMSCSAHNYPLMLSSAFSNGARETFANIVTEIEVVSAPVDRNGLASRGAKGMIIIDGQDLIASLRALPGAFTAGMDTEVEVVASIIVDGRNGRLLGSTISGNGRAQGSAGLACDGGAKSLTQASEQAIRQTLTRLAETFANSDRVR